MIRDYEEVAVCHLISTPFLTEGLPTVLDACPVVLVPPFIGGYSPRFLLHIFFAGSSIYIL